MRARRSGSLPTSGRTHRRRHDARRDAGDVAAAAALPTTTGSRGMRRVALLGEREEDPAAEALLQAGAQLVLPAGDAEQLGRQLWAAAAAHSD